MILNQKNDINNEFTQIVNWYNKENFLNPIAWLETNLPITSNASGWSFRSLSQTNVHNMVPYEDSNIDAKFDGPPEYDYCGPNIDPDFRLY